MLNYTQKFTFSFMSFLLLFSGGACSGNEETASKERSSTVEAQLRENVKEAFKNPSDVPGRPKVLLIGDSISIGYTQPVRDLLDGKVLVYRPSVNCQDSGNVLKNLDKWLGNEKWDVIHFNCGIWDTHYLDAGTGKLIASAAESSVPADTRKIRTSLEKYRENLTKIVQRLKQTDAKLIWAQSTPVMFREGDRFEDIKKYNSVASEVMKENGVTVSDFYAYTILNVKKWQENDKCHFNMLGNKMLATKVVGSIRAAIEQKNKSSDNMQKGAEKMNDSGFKVHKWVKHPNNPVLPPGGCEFDVKACMNPSIVRQGDEYYLFYAGADKNGTRRICLAIAKVSDLTNWKRLGPIFDVGGPGSFDETWCVLPLVYKIGNKWHLYYTGRSGLKDVGLQAFWGMGLATSDDLIHWKKYSEQPILSGDGFPEWPANKGIAGGGVIMELPQADGSILYRMYYTLPTGTPSKDLIVDQAKQAVIAHSKDGINWFDKRVVLKPRLEADYENAATIALVAWKTQKGTWRAIYAGIGSRFGAYSLCEASSKDGLVWERGNPDENLAIPPSGDGWECKMVEYPCVVQENGKLRLFYCGNGYGATGIGTAIADPIEE